MSTEVTALEQESTTLAADVQAMAITDAESYERAGGFVRTIAAYIKRVGEVMDPIVAAAHNAHKIAVAQRATLLVPADTAKRVLGQRMAAWEQEQARRRREAEAAAQQERERLEREAREQAAAEQRRLQQEAEGRRLEEAARLEAAGDRDGAERLIAAPVPVPVVAPAPVFAPQPAVPAAPKLDGVSYQDVWDFEITNPALLPREYLMPDEKKIRGVVKAMRGAAAIPGVRAFARRVAAVRA